MVASAIKNDKGGQGKTESGREGREGALWQPEERQPRLRK